MRRGAIGRMAPAEGDSGETSRFIAAAAAAELTLEEAEVAVTGGLDGGGGGAGGHGAVRTSALGFRKVRERSCHQGFWSGAEGNEMDGNRTAEGNRFVAGKARGAAAGGRVETTEWAWAASGPGRRRRRQLTPNRQRPTAEHDDFAWLRILVPFPYMRLLHSM